MDGCSDPLDRAAASLDEHRRSLAAYPLRKLIVSRVADLDGNGHLNSVRLCEFYEDARAGFHTTLAFRGVRSFVAEFTVRYIDQAFWPGELQVGTGILRVGNSSFVLAQGLFQDARCVGLCDTVLVHVVDRRPQALPDAYREALVGQLIAGAPRPPADELQRGAGPAPATKEGE